jgi:serine/threonine protein kinase
MAQTASLSLADACEALRFESAYWRDAGTVDAQRFCQQNDRLEEVLIDLQSKLNAVRLQIIAEFEKNNKTWNKETRAAKVDEFVRACEKAVHWKPDDGTDPGLLKSDRKHRDSSRRDGILRTLVRNQFSRWLRDHGSIPEPEQILKDFEGLKVDFLVHREILSQLKVNRWRLANRKHLALGGTGEVFEVDDRQFGRKVAMKQLRNDLSPDVHGSLILNESQLTAQLNYPGVPFVLGSGMWDHRPFFVMELLPRVTLLDKLAEFHRSRLPLVRNNLDCLLLLRRLINICEIVHHAHQQQIVHRDIKPMNVLCGDAPVETYLIDWGFARQFPGHNHSPRDLELGTPDYLAPERVSGSHAGVASLEAAVLADVYSLGATLYHLISGRSPFACLTESEIVRALKLLRSSLSSDPIRKEKYGATVDEALRDPYRNALVAGLRSEQNDSNAPKILQLRMLLVPLVRFPRPRQADGMPVDAELASICRKAMNRDPQRRHPTAGELASRLERWIADAPDADYAVWFLRHPFIWLRRHRRFFKFIKVVSVLGTILIAALAIAGAVIAANEPGWITRQLDLLRNWYQSL